VQGLVFTLKAKGGCITSGIGGHAFLIKKVLACFSSATCMYALVRCMPPQQNALPLLPVHARLTCTLLLAPVVSEPDCELRQAVRRSLVLAEDTSACRRHISH